MKILHVTATHLNLVGGVPVVLRDLVSAQNRVGKSEARVLSIKADITKMQSEYFDYLGDDSFERYIKSFIPDVVIFHSHYCFEYLRLYRILIKRNIPYFIEPHGSFGKAALQKSRLKKSVANNFVLRSYLKNAYGYVFLNENEKNDAQFRTSNDVVIPNGINIDNIEVDYNPQVPWCFYFIGRFDVIHKGLDYLFDALEILDKQTEKISVKIYGSGSNEEIEYVNKRIKSLHSISVHNFGPIYAEDQVKELEQCGVMLLTSRYEGFPMTVLEAWKYGNPCLVTFGTNVAEETAENGLGWKCKLDSASIANNIREGILDYSKNRADYIHRCKEYVMEKYSWNAIAQVSFEQLSKSLKWSR